MSLVKHAKSPYWYMSFQVNNKPVFKSTKTTNKAQAQRIEAETRKQMIEALHFEVKEEATLKEVIDFYVDSRKDCGRITNDETYSRKLLGTKISPTTKKIVSIYGFEASMMFHDLKTRDLFKLLTARRSEGNSDSTVIQELLFINGLIKTAKQLGYRLPDIDTELFKKEHKLKQAKKPIRYLSADEEARLLAELDPLKVHRGMASLEKQTPMMKRMKQDAFDFVVVLLDSGARYDEVASITWEQIDLNEKLIRLIRPKVDNESTLYMTDRMYSVLKRRSENKNSDVHVFTAKDGGARKYNPRALASAIKRADIKNCTYHTMRKTLGSKLVRGGLAISDVSVILGHSSVTTTADYYASLCPAAASKRAMEMLNTIEAL